MNLEVGENEELARYILSSRQIRADGTVRPEALMPAPLLDMSVTRHLLLSDKEIWEIGQGVAEQRKKNLQGRLDLITRKLVKYGLQVVPMPLPDNRNHADVSNWPLDKSSQKQIALEICAEAGVVKRP